MASTTTTNISDIHADIIEAHILTGLDGPGLASVASTCTHLKALSVQAHLWANICRTTWPTTNNPRVRHFISTLPNASRSFFADSFPAATATATTESKTVNLDRTPELISAVDIFHGDRLVLSRVVETETESGWFRCSPFRVDLLDPKDTVETGVEYPRSEEACGDLKEELRLSWIVIDPNGGRAVNVSSGEAVTVRRHWLSGEVQARFATVVGGGEIGSAKEAALCSVTVTFGWEMQVKEVSFQMEDMDGMQLSGRDSLGILQRLLEGKRGKLREEGRRNGYMEFMKRKEERKERKVRAERRLDILCVGVAAFSFVAVSTFFLF
ncbi:probable F-box protein At2g36090 [Lotus japonicus]|uniref:probable F-box protein At2g36090 n=1 Tax=Lotus japonicus TaxID=34305 RepID=UPI00258FDE97|nr:probable F-box protein At2g36090 [Lotus japonicus]